MSGLTPTVRLNGGAKHRPASHPLVRRASMRRELLRELVDEHPGEVRDVLYSVEGQRQGATDTIEEIARLVAQLPDVTFSVEQRRMCAVIAAELHRRGRNPKQVRREGFYRRTDSAETEARHAAITAAVKDGRRIQEIADEFGVSKQLVSRVAIARGVRRRHRRPA